VDRCHSSSLWVFRGAVIATALINQIERSKALLLAVPTICQALSRHAQHLDPQTLNPNGVPRRSYKPLPETERWSAPTLILHGTGGGMAQRFRPIYCAISCEASANRNRGFASDRGHWLRLDEIKQPAMSFVAANGGHAKRWRSLISSRVARHCACTWHRR
jgi:hypothetical protein